MGNTIAYNRFNKHNDQEKKTLVKRTFFTCMEFIQFNFIRFNLVILKFKRIPSVSMYALNILNDVIDLMQREICRSKQMTDFIAWPSRCHDMIHVDVSYQVSVHLVRQFQRRRFFRYRPIRKKNCLWWPCVVMEHSKMCSL